MATETIFAISHVAGTFTNPNNALGAQNATWAGAVNVNTSTTSRWLMDTPAGYVVGSQLISVLCRKGSNKGNPTIALNLWENGVLKKSLAPATAITSTTGQIVSGTFEESDISDFSKVQIEVVQSAVGGSVSARNSAQVDSITWTVTTEAQSGVGVVNKQWSNGDILAFDMDAGGISVSSAPNNTGAPRQTTVNVKTTNEGVKASAGLTVSQGVRPAYAYGWGGNYYGECGRGDFLSPKTNVAKINNNDNNWSQISGGSNHVLAIKGGYLYAWGYNYSGQLGNNTSIDSNTPIQIGTHNDWSYVYAGTSCSFAIRGGYLYAWGDNSYQQLGLPTGVEYRTPTQVGSFNDWVKVANGPQNHTLAIRGNGLLYGVGRNSWDMLGTGNNTNLTQLTQIGTETGWTHIGAGDYHSVGIRDGKLWSTGLNNNGQLGHASSNIFLQIGTDSDWRDISVFSSSNFALKTNNNLYAWGLNDFNKLGLQYASESPAYVMGGVEKLDIGFSASCVISNAGKLFVVGYNGGGELGLGDTLNRTSFTAVGIDTDWVACQVVQSSQSIIALKQS